MANRPRLQDHRSSDPLVFEGATQTELSRMFRMSSADVKSKISTVPPVGRRSGYDVYAIHEVAPYLAKMQANVVDRVLRMHPNDLPKMLSKEYWAGQNNRLTVLQRVGDLWDTRAVVENAGEAFKTIRLSLMLLSDAVEREVGLTPAQRDIIGRLVENCLVEMQEKLVDGFNKRREGSIGKSFAPREDDLEDDDL